MHSDYWHGGRAWNWRLQGEQRVSFLLIFGRNGVTFFENILGEIGDMAKASCIFEAFGGDGDFRQKKNASGEIFCCCHAATNNQTAFSAWGFFMCDLFRLLYTEHREGMIDDGMKSILLYYIECWEFFFPQI